MITIVALRIASSTTEDMFGGVSMNTHSIAIALGLRDDFADRTCGGFQLRFVGAAQFVPQRERALRIGIDKQTWLGRFVDVCSKMRRQGAFPRSTFSRRKNNYVHILGLQIDPRAGKVNQIADSLKINPRITSCYVH